MADFTSFEHEGWQRTATAYADAFGQLTTQCIPRLLDSVGVARGTRLLDVASGPGYAAAAAAGRGATAVGVDFASEMVASAAAAFPHVEYRQGSADSLPFDDRSFDAVVINFGLFHFEHPDRALAEAMRVLRPGGKVAFTAWAKPERALMYSIVLGAISAHGRTDVGLPQGPMFFQYSDPEGANAVLNRAGFHDPTFEYVPQTWCMGSPANLFERMSRSTVRMGALLAKQSPEARANIARAVEEGARQFQPGSEVRIPADAILAKGTKA